MPMRVLSGSSTRSTTFSPHSVGSVFTRKSMARVLESFILMRPSWGIRRSEMSSADITLSRAARRLPSWAGGAAASCSMPSVRNRTR